MQFYLINLPSHQFYHEETIFLKIIIAIIVFKSFSNYSPQIFQLKLTLFYIIENWDDTDDSTIIQKQEKTHPLEIKKRNKRINNIK